MGKVQRSYIKVFSGKTLSCHLHRNTAVNPHGSVFHKLSLSLFDDIIDYQGLYTCINTPSFLVPSLLRINNPQVGFSLELFWLVVFLHLPVLVGAELQCYTLATGWGIEFDFRTAVVLI